MKARPLFDTGIRPIVDDYLAKLSEEKRDYGDYWSASSAGYCMRKVIMERLQIPYTSTVPRVQRVFSAGDVFHEWLQRITKGAGVSIAQELELVDDERMIKGHVDDLVLINDHLILYDYKSAHSRSFHYAKDRPMSYYHKMQVGTYMYMLRSAVINTPRLLIGGETLKEARVLKISKDDLCMMEHQLLWTPALEKEITRYWDTLNRYWKSRKLPKCTCKEHEGGFMASAKYNPYFYEGKPCSLAWYRLKLEERQ